MIALSVQQPFASLLLAGVKTAEMRSYFAPHAAVGQRFAIHASKRIPPDCQAELEGIQRKIEQKKLPAMPFPLGSILGTVLLVGCRRPTTRRDLQACLMPPHEPIAPEYVMWEVTDPVWLSEPIPCRGMPGYWQVPAQLLPRLDQARGERLGL